MTSIEGDAAELEEVSEAVPPAVRTVAYYAALIVGALATGASTIAAAIAPDIAPTVAAVAGAISGVVATVAGGLGVVYRPRPLEPAP